MTATCPRCSNTGYLGDRFCSCPFADTLRDRIETAPEFAEFRRKRAEVDRKLAAIAAGRPEIDGIPPSYGWLRPIAVPADAPADVRERIRAYNALIDQPRGELMAFVIPNPLPISCTDCHQAMRVEFQSTAEWCDGAIVAAECRCGRAFGLVSFPALAAHRHGQPVTRANIEVGDDVGKQAAESIARAREHIAERERWIAAATWANGGRKS